MQRKSDRFKVTFTLGAMYYLFLPPPPPKGGSSWNSRTPQQQQREYLNLYLLI